MRSSCHYQGSSLVWTHPCNAPSHWPSLYPALSLTIPYMDSVALTSFDGPLFCVGRRALRLIRTCNCRWWRLLRWSLLWWSLLPLLCRARCLGLAHTSHLRLYDNCSRLSNNHLTTCRVDVLNGLAPSVDVLDCASSLILAAKQRKVNCTSHPCTRFHHGC